MVCLPAPSGFPGLTGRGGGLFSPQTELPWLQSTSQSLVLGSALYTGIQKPQCSKVGNLLVLN